MKKTKRPIFTYIVLGLIALILLTAIICSLIFEGPKLQVIWGGAVLLMLNLLFLIFFLRRNLR